MVEIEKLEKLREKVDYLLMEIGDSLVDIRAQIELANEICNKISYYDRELSEEEFDQFLRIGVTVGAEISIEDTRADPPFTVTGISSDGFVVTDGKGRKFKLDRRCLRYTDKIKVVQK